MKESIIRIPFLISADQKLYVHWTHLPRDEAFEAYKGFMRTETIKVISDEVAEHDPSAAEITIHGTLAWMNQETVSLSEFGLFKDHVNSRIKEKP